MSHNKNYDRTDSGESENLIANRYRIEKRLDKHTDKHSEKSKDKNAKIYLVYDSKTDE